MRNGLIKLVIGTALCVVAAFGQGGVSQYPNATTTVTGGTITAPAGTDLTLNGGSGSGSPAQLVVGSGNNPSIRSIASGLPTSGEYFYGTCASPTGTSSLDLFCRRDTLTVNWAVVNHTSAGLSQTIVPVGNNSNHPDYIAGDYPIVYYNGGGIANSVYVNHATLKTAGSGGYIDFADLYNTETVLESGTNYIKNLSLYHAVVPINTAATTKPDRLSGFYCDDFGATGSLATAVFCIDQPSGNTPSRLSGALTVGALNTAGAITLTNTQNSGSVTTGAIINPGGIGIAKDTYIGGILNLGTTGSTLSQNGIQFGSSTEGITRVSSGQFKWLGSGALTLDMDLKFNTNLAYDIGTTSVRPRIAYAGTTNSTLYATTTNCSSSASPAVCAAAAAGSVVVAAAATTVVVNTSAVTANSQILVTYDAGLGTKLGVTCNTTIPALYGVTARAAGTSFTITSSAPVTDPACFSYEVIN